jgi:hypothetical protein
MWRDRPIDGWRPGDGVLHPLVVAALVVLLLNDHVLKGRWPGVVTGKLSDVAGLVLFPILLFSLVEIGSAALGHRSPPSDRVLLVCLAVTAVAFAASELLPEAERGLETAFGWARWPIDRIRGAAGPTVLTRDPTDLLALPALAAAAAVGRPRSRGRARHRRW